MNVGSITRDDGSPGTSAAARLYRWFREHSGREVSTKDLEREISTELGICSAIQRIQEIRQQLDPRIEWIVKRVERIAGRNCHYYRYLATHGQVPECAHERHCQILRGLDGEHDQPVRSAGVATWYGSRARSAAPARAHAPAVAAPVAVSVAASDRLFNDAPLRPA